MLESTSIMQVAEDLRPYPMEFAGPMQSVSEKRIRWRLMLKSDTETVHRMLSTDEGRSQFWAETAPEVDGAIEFSFPNGQSWCGKIIESRPPRRFSVEYIGGTRVTFDLSPSSDGGTELLLMDNGVSDEDYLEVSSGWVSVLLALKAAVDFGVDLRNHNSDRCWDQRYVEN